MNEGTPSSSLSSVVLLKPQNRLLLKTPISSSVLLPEVAGAQLSCLAGVLKSPEPRRSAVLCFASLPLRPRALLLFVDVRLLLLAARCSVRGCASL
ncbi:hypothetical protein BVRB_4g087390 [Beta vulgaris subsp. vulgaris]|nr:hypothetical protein BVRB_4g087390 [Beta vulgaris subsp. vulgaris]